MNTDGMTDEQMRKTVAEKMGFSNVQVGPWYGYLANGHANHAKNVPSYLTDLNAMAEAEKTLTADQCWEYNRKLSELLGTAAGMGSGHIEEWSWHATARQRAITFLRTLP